MVWIVIGRVGRRRETVGRVGVRTVIRIEERVDVRIVVCYAEATDGAGWGGKGPPLDSALHGGEAGLIRVARRVR